MGPVQLQLHQFKAIPARDGFAEYQPLPVIRQCRRELCVGTLGQLFDGAGPIRRLPEQVARAKPIRCEDEAAVGCPDRVVFGEWVRCDTRERHAGQIPYPDVLFLVVDENRHTGAIGRKAWIGIAARRRGDGRLTSVAVYPYERAPHLHHATDGGDVDQRTVTGERRIHGAGAGHRYFGNDWHRCAARLQRCQVEGHGPQRPGCGVDEVPTGRVAGVSAAAQKDLALPGVQMRTTTCAASTPPVAAVIVNNRARPPGSSSGHK